MNATHPLGVALGKVVVDGDDVNTLARKRIEVRGQRGNERLALTCAHLGDVPEMKGGAAHELNVVMPLPEGSACRLSNRGESLRQEVVE